MSKTIEIQCDPSPFKWGGERVRIDVTRFAKYVNEDLRKHNPATLPLVEPYCAANLLAVEGTRMVLTPRGEDLLASAHLIPDDPEPVQAVDDPCDACDADGKQALFMSKHVCDVCGGSKVKPRLNAYFQALHVETTMPRIDTQLYTYVPPSPWDQPSLRGGGVYAEQAPRRGPVSVAEGWVRINSAEDATRFIGRLVEVHAPAGASSNSHELHGQTARLDSVGVASLFFAAHALCLAVRDQVMLRDAEARSGPTCRDAWVGFAQWVGTTCVNYTRADIERAATAGPVLVGDARLSVHSDVSFPIGDGNTAERSVVGMITHGTEQVRFSHTWIESPHE